MRRRVYIFVRGILGWPGDSREWNSKAVSWVHRNTDDRAENFETLVGPIDRVFGQHKRARNFAVKLREYYPPEDWNIVLVGHSNGTDVLLKGLRIGGWPRIEAIHLVSSACEANFQDNGLNYAISAKRVGRVCLYRAGKDAMLRLAQTWPGKWLGYGTLGLHGPLNQSDGAKERTGEIVQEHFGHSTWFTKANFERSMRHFTTPINVGNKLWTS